MGIPRGPEDVTPAWLGSVLETDVREVDVTADRHRADRCDVSGVGDVSTPNSRVCPNSFAVKLSAQDDAVRERVALGYRSEVEFYSRIADKMRIPVPQSFHCDISDDGADVVLLLGRHGAGGAGRSDRRLHARRGSAGGGSSCGTARPELV